MQININIKYNWFKSQVCNTSSIKFIKTRYSKTTLFFHKKYLVGLN